MCNTYCNFTRQQAEAKLKHLTSHHETTETVSQHEVTEWKEKYEQSKEKAKEYSELVSMQKWLKFSEMKLQLDFYLSRQNYGNYVRNCRIAKTWWFSFKNFVIDFIHLQEVPACRKPNFC